MSHVHIFYVCFLLIFCVWLEYFYLRQYNFHKYINIDLYENPFIRNDDDIERDLNFPLRSKIVITGLARNIEERIDKNLRHCRLLGSYFSDYKIIIFENDSTDNTRNIIKDVMKRDENVKLIESDLFPDCKLKFPILYHYGVVHRERIRKMAFYRNICQHFIYKHFSDYDYVLVLDFDVEGDLPILKILESISKKDPWSAIGANGRSPIPGTFGHMDTMYDAMAFCETEQDVENSKYENHYSFFTVMYKYFRMMSVTIRNCKTRYKQVRSTFNGLCIYKLKDIQNLFYTDEYICEHISFNQQLSRVFIDLELSLCVGHQGPKHVSDFL